MSSPLLLIDGDIYAYRATAACQEVYHWGDDLVSNVVSLSDATRLAQSLCFDAVEPIDSSGQTWCFSCASADGWRRRMYSPYKAKRREAPPIVGLQEVKRELTKLLPSMVSVGLEADDILGIGITTDPESVAVTIDKDLATVPGLHFNPHRDSAVRRVTLAEANRNLAIQALSGDSTDGYPGIPNVGPKRAAGLLQGVQDWEDEAEVCGAILAAYEAKGLSREEGAIQAQMARICRAGDWDYEKKEMVWNPLSLA